jgi:hypothetical protein
MKDNNKILDVRKFDGSKTYQSSNMVEFIYISANGMIQEFVLPAGMFVKMNVISKFCYPAYSDMNKYLQYAPIAEHGVFNYRIQNTANYIYMGGVSPINYNLKDLNIIIDTDIDTDVQYVIDSGNAHIPIIDDNNSLVQQYFVVFDFIFQCFPKTHYDLQTSEIIYSI